MRALAFAVAIMVAASIGFAYGRGSAPGTIEADEQALGLAYGCGWTDSAKRTAEALSHKTYPPLDPSPACKANAARASRWGFVP